VRDGEGLVVRFEGVQDMTAEKEAEQAAMESEERFRLLARASDHTIWDWNPATAPSAGSGP
jgi:PAS domain-containing protein